MADDSLSTATAKVGITEAAAILQLSPDTVRRRLKSGELSGERVRSSGGYKWLVTLPEETPTLASAQNEDVVDGVALYYRRGMCHQELGQYERAIQDFDKAIELLESNKEPLGDGQPFYFHQEGKKITGRKMLVPEISENPEMFGIKVGAIEGEIYESPEMLRIKVGADEIKSLASDTIILPPSIAPFRISQDLENSRLCEGNY